MSAKYFPLGPSNLLIQINFASVVDFFYAPNPHKSAIVNSANKSCIGGGGVDLAISSAGGQTLNRDRWALKVIQMHESYALKNIRCKTGDAKITGPNQYGRLHVPFVIHAVGPNYTKYENREDVGDNKLRGAYKASMSLAESKGIQGIAFSLISAGNYRGNRNLRDVVLIALESVFHSARESNHIAAVHFCAYSEDEYLALVEAACMLGWVRS